MGSLEWSSNGGALADRASDSAIGPATPVAEGRVVELRRRAVEALGQLRSLTAAIDATDGQAIALERDAVLALAYGDEGLGRELLDRKVLLVRRRDGLIEQLQGARCLTRELTGRMLQLEGENSLVRRACRRASFQSPVGPLDVEVDLVVCA
jgi:hypothetical protein